MATKGEIVPNYKSVPARRVATEEATAITGQTLPGISMGSPQ